MSKESRKIYLTKATAGLRW